ncbi:MAG: RNA polymerase sigma-70 factor [Hymenobacter sp.]|nr:RNA polymerase sigma-70 factor [Hymenobacter sp.]
MKVLREFSESACLARLKENDDKAFEELFAQYAAGLCRFAQSHLKSHADAEEVVQECFLKLWQKRHDLPVDTLLKSYLYTSAYHAVLNQLRRQQYWAFEDCADDLLTADSRLSNPTEYRELEQVYQGALERLPPKRRRIFTLSRQEGLSYSGIAKELGISVKSVETQMTHALKFLRAFFRAHGTPLLVFGLAWWLRSH